MKKIIPQLLVFILAFFYSNSQNVSYSLASVPEAIKNKASVIVHSENIELEVESIDKATIRAHKVFTVVNEEGKSDLMFREYTSKYVSLEDAEIRVYDGNGKVNRKYKKKEMSTTAVGEGLIEDGYVTYYRIAADAYPITVEINYELKIKSTLNIPDYRFINSNEGIIESNYTIIAPTDIVLRYKAENTTIQPVISENGKYKTYKWTVKNLTPIEYEEGAVSGSSRYPHIKIVAEHFSHYGFPGDLSTWKSFGTWIKNLYEGLDVLPAERQQFFKQMVDGAADEKEKIRRIYKYLQGNFRYVSIQLGIGGLRPFSAEFTDNKKYGDCKALSNYMKAALKCVGIKSHVAIINAEYNELPVDPGFPANDFNHVILCVPGQQDSTWLECTSSITEFGELGAFTENRNALLITDDGGVLVPTPRSHSSENILVTHTSISLAEDFSGFSETIFTTKGEYKHILNNILKDNRDDQKEAVVFYFGFKQPDNFELKKDATDAQKATLKMDISKVPDFNAGGKWFMPVRIHKIWSSKLPKAENRKLDFYFPYPFEKYDTTIFKLPAGLKSDALPGEKILSCDYASYKSKSWYQESENAIYVASVLILKQLKIPSTSYAAVKKFFDDVLQDNTQKVVVKKTEPEKKAF